MVLFKTGEAKVSGESFELTGDFLIDDEKVSLYRMRKH